jgi:site-specific recombinase XerC
MHPEPLQQLARQVLTVEAQAVEQLESRIDDRFVHACELMLGCQGRIVVLGIGKSGHIAGKIAATLASTGTPAFFVHPASFRRLTDARQWAQETETAIRQAGIVGFKFHDPRHSAASYLAMNGASLAEIADVLGHETLSMVKRYAHLSESHTADGVERMNAAIFRDAAS